MTKELPHAIAPDGEVIQLTPMPYDDTADSACKDCYVLEECMEMNKTEDLALDDLLGHDCTDHHEVDDNIIVVWRKVDD